MAAVPYSSIVDSTITVKESELKDLYNKKKEQFKQYVETRNIKYIDVQVTASAEDRAAIQQELIIQTNWLLPMVIILLSSVLPDRNIRMLICTIPRKLSRQM